MSTPGGSLSRRDLVRAVTRRLIDEPENRQAWIMRLAAYLVSHGVSKQADLVINDIAHELELQAGLLTAEVVSARQLNDEMRSAIKAMLVKESGAHNVVLHEKTDAMLLGGFVARTADAEMDASVKHRLTRLSSLA